MLFTLEVGQFGRREGAAPRLHDVTIGRKRRMLFTLEVGQFGWREVAARQRQWVLSGEAVIALDVQPHRCAAADRAACRDGRSYSSADLIHPPILQRWSVRTSTW